MRSKRTIVALCAAMLLPLPASLSAQFEGTLEMKLHTNGGGEQTMKVEIKGDRQVTIMPLPADAGPMAGMEMRAIYDQKARTVTTLLPVPAMMAQMPALANAKGIKNVVDLSGLEADSLHDDATIRKLGTSEKVAGIDCDDYEITSGTEAPTRACIASTLGRFLYPRQTGGMGRRTTTPAWVRAFGNRPVFPVKVWSTDGKGVSMEVTSAQRGAIPESEFQVPNGYVDMSSMMRGR